METLEDSTTRTPKTFINYVMNFDDETKGDLMNLFQYGVLAIIPIILLNKSIQKFVPEVDEEKGSAEITLEVFLQLGILLFGMFFIHRIVTFLPMYSGKDIGSINILNVIIGFLVIVLSLQTKLGEKIEILTDRVLELWNGPQEKRQHNEAPKNIIKVSQPISQQMPTHQPSQSDNLARQMPPPTQRPMVPQEPGISHQMYEDSLGNTIHSQQPEQQQQAPAFDQMYQEPMAANESFGGFASF